MKEFEVKTIEVEPTEYNEIGIDFSADESFSVECVLELDEKTKAWIRAYYDFLETGLTINMVKDNGKTALRKQIDKEG